jgi:hypothetical protein
MASAELKTEQTFLSERAVLVTNARFVTNNQTYALGGITSVKLLMESAKNGPGIFALLGAFVLLLAAFSAKDWGFAAASIILGAIGVLVIKSAKPTHHLILRTASGEVRAISSEDGPFIARVLAAINNAMIARG